MFAYEMKDGRTVHAGECAESFAARFCYVGAKDYVTPVPESLFEKAPKGFRCCVCNRKEASR